MYKLYNLKTIVYTNVVPLAPVVVVVVVVVVVIALINLSLSSFLLLSKSIRSIMLRLIIQELTIQ